MFHACPRVRPLPPSLSKVTFTHFTPPSPPFPPSPLFSHEISNFVTFLTLSLGKLRQFKLEIRTGRTRRPFAANKPASTWPRTYSSARAPTTWSLSVEGRHALGEGEGTARQRQREKGQAGHPIYTIDRVQTLLKELSEYVQERVTQTSTTCTPPTSMRSSKWKSKCKAIKSWDKQEGQEVRPTHRRAARQSRGPSRRVRRVLGPAVHGVSEPQEVPIRRETTRGDGRRC